MIKNKGLIANLQESMNECKYLKMEVEKYKNKYDQESSREVLKLANFATERSKSSFGDNLSLINPEEVIIIKQKGEKMASNERIEYYESIIEALICKRLTSPS